MSSKSLFFTKDNHNCKELIRATGSVPRGSVSCKMKTSSSKTRNFNIFLANTGLFFIHRSIGHGPTLNRFVPIVDISMIQRVHKDQYILQFGNTVREFEAQHFDALIEELVQLRSVFEYNSSYDKPIVFEGMKNVQAKKKTTVPPNLLAMRLRAMTVKFDLKPADVERLQYVFEAFEATPRTCVNFPSEIKYVANYKLLGYPLIPEKQLSVIMFNGNAPLLVCKLIRFLLKYMKSLRTIVLKDYKDIKFEQFRFETIRNPSVVSWTFENVFTENSRRLPMLVKSFENYDGDIQTFNIHNVEINENSAKEMALTISSAHCFKALEVFSANSILTPEEEGTYKVYNTLISAISNLPMVHSVFFEYWANPVVITTLEQKHSYTFLRNNSIRSISVSHVNFTGVKSSFIFPPTLSNIEFTDAIMSHSSLKALLKSIQNIPKDNITLSLEHLSLKKKSWDSFFEDSKDLCLNNLIELDWTGNYLQDSYIEAFKNIFLSNQNFKFLSIGEIFDDNTADSLISIINHISKYRVWGLDIHGNQKLYFNKRIVDVFKSISKLTSLEHINISNHFLTDGSIRMLYQILEKSLKIVHEVSMDGESFSDFTALYCAYEQLSVILKIESIQRPIIDVAKIFPKEELMTDRFAKFKQFLKATKKPSTRFERMCFYQNSLDLTSHFFEYFKKFPISAYSSLENDVYGFSEIEQQNGYSSSLFDKSLKPIMRSFAFDQNLLLDSPFKTPSYQPKTNFVIAKTVKNCRSFVTEIPVEEEIEENKEEKVDIDDILNRYQSYISQSFLPVLYNLQTLNKIFKSVEDEKDEFPKSDDIPMPKKFISDEGITIIQNKCEDIINQNEKKGNELQSTTSMNNIESTYNGTTTMATTFVGNNTTLSTFMTVNTNMQTTMLTTMTTESTIYQDDDYETIQGQITDKSNVGANKEYNSSQQIHLAALPSLSKTEDDEDAVEIFSNKFDVSEMEQISEIYSKAQKDTLQTIRKLSKKFSDLKLNNSSKEVTVKPLPIDFDINDDISIPKYFKSLSNEYCSSILEKSTKEIELGSISDEEIDILSQELLSYDDYCKPNDELFGFGTSPISPSLGIAFIGSLPNSSISPTPPTKVLSQSPNSDLFDIPPPLIRQSKGKIKIPPPISLPSANSVNIPVPLAMPLEITIPPLLKKNN